jgi:hypothetical protein
MSTIGILAQERSSRIAVKGEDGAMRIYDLFPIELPDHASCRMTLLRIAAMPTNVAALLSED